MKQQGENAISPNPPTAWEPFHKGRESHAFALLGAHCRGNGVTFRIWAPRADSVAVIGDFNGWDPGRHPMVRVGTRGVWEIAIEGVKDGDNYKYLIRTGSRVAQKADPYGVRTELPPRTASVVCNPDGYEWRDAGWLSYRKDRFTRERLMRRPIHVYQVEAGSWRRHTDGRAYSYAELAAELVTYVKQMGYTHVELLPLAEYLSDPSRVCGFFAPTARYGSPYDLMTFVDRMHEAGIGVILHWSPGCFSKDPHGLYELDGQPLYEPRRVDRMEHPISGTRRFDLSRPEVQSFLLSNAVYWIETYHLDGLHLDGLTPMLYLDYGRQAGEWTPNALGDSRDLESVAFLQRLNRHLEREFPDVLTVAAESTAWPHLTSLADNGLGFSLKSNVGWQNDTLAYFSEDPLWRRYHYGKLTYPLTYAFGERHLLPLSREDAPLLPRMPGDRARQLAEVRLALAFQMTLPGKKHTRMGTELGQLSEPGANGALAWSLLGQDIHAALQLFAAELNHFYLSSAPLWERDGESGSFAWIDAENAERSLLSFRRVGTDGAELLAVFNFTPSVYESHWLALPEAGAYEEAFNTDCKRFGGGGVQNAGILQSEISETGEHAVRLRIPPTGALVLRRVR